ncbi:MAG: hypothetical protein J6R86_04960 [Lentisphaeria bacterium]|nr:hypothetical protein [Lentisphaeria bacterium]
MKFAAGYQCITDGQMFSEIVADYRNEIGEIYFAFPGIASGRPCGGNIPERIEQLEYELACFRQMGIALDILFNGNCYGSWAVSEKFQREIVSTLERLESLELLPEIVTTTSPFAAAVVKRCFPEIEIRASVNMRIDSTTAMEYLSDKFDSFYIRRDLQRDMETVKAFHSWCRANGKKLCMLANSGCLRNCPYQTFHDNLVAHDAEIREVRNVHNFMPHLCWERYRKAENRSDFLRSSWIRPEDVQKYEPFIDVMKLATRQHISPRMILGAYIAGRFEGNMYDLTEPCFSQHFAPEILDNRALDGVELPGKCASNCIHCGKCEDILARAALKLSEEM